MKAPNVGVRSPIAVLSLLTLAVAMLIGCSSDSITSSTSNNYDPNEPWNPPPGYEIVPGREVPRLNADYWESQNGQQINPNLYSSFTSVNIGRNGGTVMLGNHRYVIPAGALSRTTTMTMRYASEVAVGVDCGPSPLYFSTPVTLTLSYDGSSYEEDGMDPSDLRIWYVATDGTLEEVGGTVDQDAQTVSAEVDHFSRYILG